ncbi:hypothetical protein QA640_24065 [Bradyrhizobium sp. CB82]|uniref:DUF6894 family protein n=1 Tax=Bradyrhizobium sp. CB82 TaxID=3039159 RepID=UPI0024B1D446|nr:hypothetical protein [Bradyrhizobium sp. CB82]WFU37552.1 hypothetical protein QA640_24065 [Bradyrhizobium sp. CB82]
MIRYFFDIRDGAELYPDEEGLELPNERAAEIEAAHTLAAMARDATDLGDRHDTAIEVRTEAGPVFQLALVFEVNRLKN